jgi:hypothetical protein
MKTSMTSDADYETGDVLTWSIGRSLHYEARKTGPDEWWISNNIRPETLTKPFAWLRSVIERSETHSLTRKAHQREDCWCGRHHAPGDFL